MNTTWQIGILIVLAVLAANLPFANQRILLVGPQRSSKPLFWRLIELVVLYFVVGGIGLAMQVNFALQQVGLPIRFVLRHPTTLVCQHHPPGHQPGDQQHRQHDQRGEDQDGPRQARGRLAAATRQ